MSEWDLLLQINNDTEREDIKKFARSLAATKEELTHAGFDKYEVMQIIITMIRGAIK